MPEDFKIKLKAWARHSNGSNVELVAERPSGFIYDAFNVPRQVINTDPFKCKERVILLKDFDDLAMVLGHRYDCGPVDIEITIPILTQCEIKKKKIREEIADIEKRLKQLSPIKEEIAKLESKLNEIKEDCSGN